MPIKNLTKKEEQNHKFVNLTALAKEWLKDVKKGKKGLEILYDFLEKQNMQVQPIIPWNIEKEEQLYTKEQKIKQAEETIFDPDFLVCNKNDPTLPTIFFADAKFKTEKRCLGWVNVTDYDKYRKGMQILHSPFKLFRIYWIIEETKEIFVLKKLINPKKFEIRQEEVKVYLVPIEKLEPCGTFEEKH